MISHDIQFSGVAHPPKFMTIAGVKLADLSAAGDRWEEGDFVAAADLHIAIAHFLVDRNQNPGPTIKGAVEWLATPAQQRHQIDDRSAIGGEFKLFRLQPESFRKTRKIENFSHC